MTLKDRVQASVKMYISDRARHQAHVRWLADNVGLVNFFYSNEAIGKGEFTYHFYDAQDAILFKLKFGGE